VGPGSSDVARIEQGTRWVGRSAQGQSGVERTRVGLSKGVAWVVVERMVGSGLRRAYGEAGEGCGGQSGRG
jgi:hypothetical protein